MGRGIAVRVLAWAFAHTKSPLRPTFDRAFRHHDQAWRDEVWKDAWKRYISHA